MTAPEWFKFQFLIGEWVGQGGGVPGQGGGTLIFHFDLQGQVILRKNHVEFPAVQGRPAFSHNDMTVIYADPAGFIHASYFDNEGHAIPYMVGATEDGKMITFVSEPTANSPRFRTTYIRQKDDAMIIRFEIAPPDQPEEFAIYTEGEVIKVPSSAAFG